MKVIHLFDRYLNHTMNWANRLIEHAECENHISANIYFDNSYLSDFTIHKTSIQKYLPIGENEWKIPVSYKVYGALFKKYHVQNVLKYSLKNNIDIAHAHFANVGMHYLPLAKAGIPLVVSFYGYDYEKLPHLNPGVLSKYRELFEVARIIICEGKHGREVLKRMGCPDEKSKHCAFGCFQINYSR